jgi:molecular chaperone GrpE (heat shock protein)
MSEDDKRRDREENLSTVGSGRVDALFDDIEATIEELDRYPSELENVRRRIAANEGETSGHVRNRVTQDADGLTDDVERASERLRKALEDLKRTV